MERYCVICGEKIEECMGFVFARDFFDFLNERRKNIREICGKDALRLYDKLEEFLVKYFE